MWSCEYMVELGACIKLETCLPNPGGWGGGREARGISVSLRPF